MFIITAQHDGDYPILPGPFGMGKNKDDIHKMQQEDDETKDKDKKSNKPKQSKKPAGRFKIPLWLRILLR